MIELDPRGTPPVRRMSVVVRALRPLQRDFATLQDRLAFLTAKKLFTLRKDGTTEIEAELAECCGFVDRLRAELEAAVETLPPKALADTRVADTRMALDRAEQAIAALARRPSEDTTGG